jgi:hypothetical protein
MPLVLRSLAIGLIASSIFSVAGLLVVRGTWVTEIFNGPAVLFLSILGNMLPSRALDALELDGSGPAIGSIFFWVVTFAAIHFFWSRHLCPQGDTKRG